MKWEFTLVDSMGESTNSFYNPEKSRDGGGYWQYKGYCIWKAYSPELHTDKLLAFHIEDSSCGNYGTRKAAYIFAEPGAYHCSWGSMTECGIADLSTTLYAIGIDTLIDKDCLYDWLNKSFAIVIKQAKERWDETHPNHTKGGWLD